MPKPRRPQLTARKAPRQARSTELVDTILQAAVRVLVREGAARFTTVRVAAAAGVSVGSLYQYFPNKEALLFRLQAREWEETWPQLDAILTDRRVPPRERLRTMVIAFFRSEHAEADLRTALDDAGALFRDAPEARALEARARKTMQTFLAEALPDATPARRAFAADFVFTTMGAIAERVTARQRTPAEITRWAETCADLLDDFLDRSSTPQAERHGRRA